MTFCSLFDRAQFRARPNCWLMPTNPADLEWWQWLLIAFGFAMAALYCAMRARQARAQHKPGESLALTLCIAGTAAGLLCLFFALCCYMGWIWLR